MIMIVIVTFLGAMIDIRVFRLEMRISRRYSEKVTYVTHAGSGLAYQCQKSLHPI